VPPSEAYSPKYVEEAFSEVRSSKSLESQEVWALGGCIRTLIVHTQDREETATLGEPVDT
jgi:hypothetical protein